MKGAISPKSTIRKISQPPARLRSLNPRIAVSATFAWISAPDMTSSPDPATAWTSCSDVAVGPITTSLLRNADGGTFPSITREYEYEVIVPGRPTKSIQGFDAAGRLTWPFGYATSAATMPKLFSPWVSHGTWRMTPSESPGRIALPGRAPSCLSTSSPPKMAVWPWASTSVVASTTFPARPTASISLLSHAALALLSVNWMSTAIARGSAFAIWSITRAW